MGSEIQPGIMRAQKREIQINRVTSLVSIDQKINI
jgi:hypothetical protein